MLMSVWPRWREVEARVIWKRYGARVEGRWRDKVQDRLRRKGGRPRKVGEQGEDSAVIK